MHLSEGEAVASFYRHVIIMFALRFVTKVLHLKVPIYFWYKY